MQNSTSAKTSCTNANKVQKFFGRLIIAFAVVFTLFSVSVNGQSIVNYSYTTNLAGSLEDLSSGSTVIMTGNNDDLGGTVTPIGFDFYFMGVRYSHFSANSNGQMTLHTTAGATAIASQQSSLGSGTVTLCPFNGDNEVNNGIRIKIIGSAPNRKLVVEWNQFYVNFVNITNAGNMQVWITEGTGVINYVYGEIYNSSSSSQTRSIFLASSNTATTAGSITINSSPTAPVFTPASSLVVNTIAAGNGTTTAAPLINNIGSSSNSARRTFNFTPPTALADPTALNFTAVTASTMTLNWTAASPLTNIVKYAVYNSTDGGVTYNFVNTTNVGTNTLAVTGLIPATSYIWKVYSISEGALSASPTTGTQATNAAAAYTWNGTISTAYAVAGNWTPTRTTPATTDVLTIDGTVTAAPTITGFTSQTIGQLIVTNNANASLLASAVATLTISGGAGADLDVQSGSTLNLSGTVNTTLAFTGTQTANVAGTLKTSTTATGTLNFTNCVATISGTLDCSSTTNAYTGTASTTSFTSTGTCIMGSNSIVIPVATWAATSNLNITGAVAATSVTNGAQSFGNITYNSTGATGILGFFAAGTVSIQGSLTIQATNTGRFRALTSGTLNIAGDLNVNGGTFEVASTTGTINVTGTVNVAGGVLDITSGTGAANLKAKGTFNQSSGTINATGTSTTNNIEFNGTSSQNVTIGTMGTGPVGFRVNNATGITLNGTMLINNTASLTISSGNISGSGTVSYSGATSRLIYNGTASAQTANSTEFPAASGPASLTINNTNTSPNNVVSIPFSRSLGSGGVLTLTAGILDNTGNTLTITNTTTGGISGGSATSYVKGVVARTLPASLVSGSTYTFPVGKGSYNPFELVNPTTNAGGTVLAQAEVFDANSGGTPGTGMASINTSRYWAASLNGGSAVNFTNSLVKLNDTRGTQDGIAASATQGGAYDHIGGGVSTLNGTSITTTAPAVTSLAGFFLMGNVSAPVLSNLAITPTGNQCTNVARTVTVTATPGGGAITTVTLNYQVNGGSIQTVSMTNTSGNDWSGTIPTVTPSTGAVTWSVTATDANTFQVTATGTTYTDEPVNGVTATASATLTTVCSGNPTVLSVILAKPVTATIGTATTATTATEELTAFCNRRVTFQAQSIYLASELNAAGLSAGAISSIKYNINSIGDAATNTNYTVKIATTGSTTLSGFVTSGFTTVFGPVTYTHAVGLNTITFTTPYVWDGTSNLIIELTHGGIDAINNAQTVYTDQGVNRTAFGFNGTTSATLSTKRFNVIFTGNAAPAATAYSWSDGTNVVGTTNPLTINPTNTATYSVTVTAANCPVVSNTVTVTVNPLPASPGANNSVQCGTGAPAAFVTSSGGGGGFKWYTAQTGGTLLQSGASATYTTPISTTTHFWVSEVGANSCESQRVEVVASVNEPDPVSASSDGPVCPNTNLTLTATVTGNTNENIYTYTWAANPSAGSGIPTTVSGGSGTFGTPASTIVSPTVSGTYTYTVTGVDGTLGCTTTASVTVTVNAIPAPVVITPAAPAAICAGSSVTLNGVSGGAASATVTSGTISIAIPDNNATGISNTLVMSGVPVGATIDSVIATFNITHGFDQDILVNLTAPNNQIINLVSGGTGFITSGTNFTNTRISSDNSLPAIPATGAPFTGTFRADKATSGFELAPTPLPTTAVFSDLFTVPNGNWTLKIEDDESIGTGTLNGWTIKVAYHVVGDPITWSPSTGLNTTSGPTVIATPATTTTYTATATNANGCINTNTVTITVNQLPPAPSASNGTDQCGTGLSDMSVSSNNITDPQAPPFFRWYDAPTGGLLKQGSTSTTYTTPISTTTTLYVSEVSASGCEGPRSIITTVVSDPDPLTVTATSMNICVGQSFDISSSYTPDFNAFATFDLTATGGAASGVTGTVSLTANPTGSDPYTVTPTSAGTFTYTITAFDPDKGCTSIGTVAVTVSAYPVITSATATPSTVCAGATVTLNGKSIAGGAGSVTIGTASTLTSATTQPTAFCNRWPSYRMQTIYTAAELQAAGMIAGNITSMAFNISTLGDANFNNNFVVRVANTALNSFVGSTDFVSSALTTVFSVASYTHVVGVNTITFTTPFNWNGTSNIIVEVIHDGADALNNSQTFYTASAVNMVAYTTTAASNTASFSTQRLNVVFGAQAGVDNTANYNWTWNPGNINAGTTGTATVNPTTTTTYTVSATAPGSSCAATATTTVTVNPLPDAPITNTPVTRCGPGSVTLTASGGGGTFNWYTVPTGGTSTFTGASYTTTVSVGSTTFYVDETSAAGCTGPRSAVVITATTPPTLAITPGGTTTFCQGGSVTLNGATGSNPSYVNFTWSASPSTGAGLSSTSGSSITVTPTVGATYTITLTADDNGVAGCANTATIVVTMNPNPVITSAIANPATICNGGSASLTATSINAVTGTAQTATPTTTTQGGSPFRAGGGSPAKTQLLYTAAELQAAGFAPGNFTSIGFNFTSAPGGTLPNFTIRMGHTTAATLNGTFEAAPSTVVYAPTSISPSTTGVFTLTFSTPFNWDGVSNLLIQFCHDLPTAVVGSGFVDATTTAGNMTNQLLTTNACNVNTGGSVQTTRPVAILGGQVGTDITNTLNWTWNPGGLTGSTVGVAPTTTTSYTVTAVNPLTTCSSSFSPVTVTVTPVGANATATPSTPVCAGTSVTLNAGATGGAPFGFSWTSTPAGTYTPDVNGNITVMPTVTTSYTVTVTDVCGNSTTSSVTVTVNPLPIVGVSPTTASFCTPGGTAVTLNGSGAVSYSWAPAAGLSATTGQTVNATPAISTTYTVTGTGANGCTATATTVITANPNVIGAIAAASPATLCAGGTINLTSSASPIPGYTMNPNSGVAFVDISGTGTSVGALDDDSEHNISMPSFTFNGTAYTTARVGSNGLIVLGSTTGEISFSNAALPSTASSAGNIFMAPWWDDLDIQTGAVAYTQTVGNNFIVQFNNMAHNDFTTGSITFEVQMNLTTGVISFVYPDAVFGDAAEDNALSATIGLQYSSSSALQYSNATASIVNGQSISFTPTTFNYSWTGPNSFTSALQNPTITNATTAASGTYTVVISTNSGCSASVTTNNVTVNPRPTGTISGSGAFCQGAANTSTNLSIAFTGTAPWNYTYTVNGGSPVSGTTSSNPLTVTVAPSSASPALFTYAISALSDANCSSIAADLSGSGTVTINPLAAAPTASVTQPTCVLGTGTITVTAPLGTGNSYTLDGGTTITWPTVSFPGVAPGPHTITVTNSFGCSAPASASVTVDPQPFAPGTPVITGVVNVCPYLGTATQQTYTAAVTGNGSFTYTWTLPPNVTLVSGGGTNSTNNFVTVTFGTGLSNPAQANKQIRVVATNQCGISPIGVFYLLTQAPVTPGPITGPTNVCALIGTATTATYTINKVLAATGYSWSVPSNASFTEPNGAGPNDTTIVVTFPAGFAGGVVSVAATNNCGANAVRTLTIVNAPPSTPALIAGPTNACPHIAPGGTAATYSVAAVAFATSYTWTAPAGAVVTHPNGVGANDNTITVLYPAGFISGAITVTATNGCGTSGVRSLSITKLNPGTPSVIDVIQTHFCGEPGGRKYTYTLASMPANATSVLWTIPTGAGISFINLTPTSIEVTYPDGAVNGTVTAQGVNNCGISSVRSTTVHLPVCATEFAGTNNTNNGTATVKGNTILPTAEVRPMEVKIFPNPTVSDFKLEVLTSRSEEINVRVLDNLGKLYKSFKLMPHQVIALGAELKAGSYFIEVRQGAEVKTSKVIKF